MEKLSVYQRIAITSLFMLVMVGTLAWEYAHGGILTHHFLAIDTMPGVSNWWGLLIIPIFVWLVSGQIKINQNTNNQNRNILLRMLSLAIVGISISFTFSSHPDSDLPFYITIGLAFLSFLIPMYKAEYLLGYVLGTLFLFGPVIPVVAGCVLWILFYVFYKTPRKVMAFVGLKKENRISGKQL